MNLRPFVAKYSQFIAPSLLLNSFLFQFLEVLHFFVLQEFVDAAEVLTDTLVAEFVDFCDEAVQEVTVMADDDEGAVKVDERLLEYVLGLHVEVVGRLVKDKEIDGLEQKFEDGKTGAFAT